LAEEIFRRGVTPRSAGRAAQVEAARVVVAHALSSTDFSLWGSN
jgi:hypothetical protein